MATKKADAPSETTAVATAASTAVAAYDYGDGETGFEEMSTGDYAIPFLGILQAISPELTQPGNEALRQGMIVNSVTGEIYNPADGVAFVPCYLEHCFMEWKPRSAGGGLVGRHELDADVVKHAKEKAGTDFGLLKSPEGNDLIETRYMYGIAIESDGTPNPAVISFSSTKMKVIKAWNTKASTIQIVLPNGGRKQAPLFAHRYRLRAISEKNNKGTFWNWDVKFDGENAIGCRLAPDDAILLQAVSLRDMLKSGKAHADTSSLTPNGGREEEDGNGAAGQPAQGSKPVF